MDNVAITNNTASSGAGIFVMGTVPTQLTLRTSTITSNAADPYSGGGLYVAANQADATVDLVDTLVSGNTSVRGGGGLAVGDGGFAGTTSAVTCTTTGAARGGFVGNTAADATLPGGAVYLASSWGNAVSFASTGCDFGASGSADDNSPSDVFVYGDTSYPFGDSAMFTCSAAGCM